MLTGIRVLDLTRLLAGPYCTWLMSEMGAEVTKVEPPAGEDGRSFGPPFLRGEAAMFMAVNRGKHGVAVDVTAEPGRQVLLDLARHSDVIVHNYRPDFVRRARLDYESFAEKNPRIVYCGITAFSETGPYADKPALDPIIQALGGAMLVSGEEGQAPVRIGIPIVDISTGMFAATSVLGALYQRDRTGAGQKIEVSLFDSLVNLQLPKIMEYFALDDRQPERTVDSSMAAPSRCFVGKDGRYFALSIFNNRFFARLCAAIDLPDLPDVPKYRDNADRVAHRAELAEALQRRFREKDAAEWVSILESADIPVGLVNDYPDLFADPALRSRPVHLNAEHPDGGDFPAIGLPFTATGAPERPGLRTPRVGEHTRDALRSLGYPPATIDRLVAQGVIRCDDTQTGESATSKRKPR